MRVIDASVASKWFLIEDYSDLALTLLESGERFAAPFLIRTEVAGAILRAWRDERITLEKAKVALAEWDRLIAGGMVECMDQDDLFDLAVRIVFQTRHTLHDCFYLALGRSLEVEVVTADENLEKRGKKAGGRVILLQGPDQ